MIFNSRFLKILYDEISALSAVARSCSGIICSGPFQNLILMHKRKSTENERIKQCRTKLYTAQLNWIHNRTTKRNQTQYTAQSNSTYFLCQTHCTMLANSMHDAIKLNAKHNLSQCTTQSNSTYNKKFSVTRTIAWRLNKTVGTRGPQSLVRDLKAVEVNCDLCSTFFFLREGRETTEGNWLLLRYLLDACNDFRLSKARMTITA